MKKVNMIKNKMLLIGASINLLLFIGHLLCLACLNTMFEIYGIADLMNHYADTYGKSFPYILTVIIAFCFLACTIYALSACKIIRRLPLIRLGIFLIAGVFILRAFWGISMMMNGFTYLELSSTSTSMIIGLLYLVGGIKVFDEYKNKK